MTVHELNQDQLEQLKFAYLYDESNDYESHLDIPNEVVFKYYADVYFIDEDFS
jgi:hypothetical protein